MIAYAFLSAALCVLLGASWTGVSLAAALGLVTGAALLLSERVPPRYSALITVGHRVPRGGRGVPAPEGGLGLRHPGRPDRSPRRAAAGRPAHHRGARALDGSHDLRRRTGGGGRDAARSAQRGNRERRRPRRRARLRLQRAPRPARADRAMDRGRRVRRRGVGAPLCASPLAAVDPARALRRLRRAGARRPARGRRRVGLRRRPGRDARDRPRRADSRPDPPRS